MLSDTAGKAIHCPSDGSSDDTDTMTFRLYEPNEGGVPLYQQTEVALAIHQGVFEVTLRQTIPIGLTVVATGEIYLGLSINGAQALRPRLRVASSAFAMRAEHAIRASTADQGANADTAGGFAAEAFLTTAVAHSLLDGKGYCEGPCYGDNNVEILLTEQGYPPSAGTTTGSDRLTVSQCAAACLPCALEHTHMEYDLSHTELCLIGDADLVNR